MAIENQMVDSGKRYGGHKLFETSVPGLYYTLKISNIWSSYTTTNISSSGMYIGDSQLNIFGGSPKVKPLYIGLVTMQTHLINTGP